MLFHSVAYMTLLLVVIRNIDVEAACPAHDGSIMRNNDTSIELTISAGLNITVKDTVKGLTCSFGNFPCYIECSFHNFFENETTRQKEIYIRVENYKNSKVDFIIGSAEDGNSSCSVIACLETEISNLLNGKEKWMKIPQDLFSIQIIKKMCSTNFSKEIYVKYIRVEMKAIDSIINMSKQSQDYSGEDLTLRVVKMDLNTTDSVRVTVPLNTKEDILKNAGNGTTVLFNESTQIQTWIPVKSLQNDSQDQLKVGIVTYASDEQFTFHLKNGVVVSKVIRIEVPDRNIMNLINPFKMHFPLITPYPTMDKNYSISCQFFDEKATEEEDPWKTNGCMHRQINDSFVECLCNHTTPFAVLLTELKIDQQHWKILSIISYIGCGLSAFFSGCSILSYIIDRNGRKEVSRSIHVSLSAALFLLNITFMFSEWAVTLNVNEVCVFVAVAIHYSLLSCFTWMAIEALHLYLLLVKVFNIYIRHYMAKLSLIGWGFPAVIIGGLLIPFHNTPFYGIKEMTLQDSNKTNEICWIIKPVITYAVNISYFTLIFVFNTGILITVSIKICFLRKVDNRHRKMPARKDVGTVLGLMCLLGTTWGLIFFTSGYTNLPVLYLFCILNSLGGFYIFIWMCGTAKKNRKEPLYDNTKSTSTDVSK